MGRTAMNTKRAMKWSLLVASAGCLAVANMPGCELLVTFDRSKIPDDGGLADGAESDGAISSTESGPGSDAETAPDGQSEASSADAPSETSTADAPTTETSVSDAGDGSTQGTADAGAEGGGGGGADSAAEAATDSGGG
jgi:hypothetical protein